MEYTKEELEVMQPLPLVFENEETLEPLPLDIN
jgi:hypothetical protein